MSSTGSINSAINSGAQAAAKATGAAAQASAVDAVAEAARKGAAALAAQVGDTAKKALETGKVMAKDEIQGFADMIFHRVQDALQGLQLMPGGLGDKIIDALGSVLSKLPLPAPAKGTNRQNMINADTLRQILKSPDTVSKQIVEDIAALWEHPNVKAITDSLNNPMEAWKKLSSLLGFGEEAKPAAQAASKPTAAKNDKTDKSEKTGWFKGIFKWFGSLAGPSDPKEIEQKLKGAGAIKKMWYKVPPTARKGVLYLGGTLAVLKLFTFGFFLVKAGIALFVGSKVLSGAKGLLGGGKSEDKPKSGIFSFLNPFKWFGGNKKASPMDQAEAAAQQPQQKAGGGLLNKFMGHAGKIAQGLQAAQTGNLGAIANMLGGGGAAPNPQNN